MPVVEIAGRNPGEWIAYQEARRDGGAQVQRDQARATAERLGADCISVDGSRKVGHPGEDDVGALVLLKAAERLTVPYIASGGIGNGRGRRRVWRWARTA